MAAWWIALLALGVFAAFLLLAILGVMRETVELRAEVAAFSRLIKNPPPPSFLNGPAPPALVSLLPGASNGAGQPTGRVLVAFLTPGCGPCQGLAEQLSKAIAQGSIRTDDVVSIVWAFPGSDWEEFAARLPGRVVTDLDGTLARACEVRGSPALLIIDRQSQQTLAFTSGGDVEWIMKNLQLASLSRTVTASS